MLERVADSWAESDPAAAAQWSASLPDGDARTQALTATMQDWVRQDPAHALSWFSNVPAGQARDEAISRFWNQLYQSGNTVQAQQWLSSMSDPQKRSSYLFDLARRWLERDPSAAQAWMSSTSDLSADAKKRLLASARQRQ
jgi:hypothetical protein